MMQVCAVQRSLAESGCELSRKRGIMLKATFCVHA